jgi:hypothetical protein
MSTNVTAEFFARLAEARHLATFEREFATLRIEVVGAATAEFWRVTVRDGDVSVDHGRGPADAIVRVRRPDLEEIITGRRNAQAALLRGVLTCEGSLAPVMTFQRCLPGPPGSTGRVAPITSQAVMAQHSQS